MPPRLAHKKSRRGCQRCKARKVKCDEMRPVCSACQRHDVPCSYSDSAPTQLPVHVETPGSQMVEDNSYPTPSISSRVSGPASPYDGNTEHLPPEERRLTELRLLHHFLTVVSKTFPTHQSLNRHQLWSNEAISYGFEHSFLINAIFATASLHAAVEPKYGAPLTILPAPRSPTPDSSASGPGAPMDYAKIHRIYLTMAVQEQRRALSDLKPSNADAVCLTSIILSIIALRLIPSGAGVIYTPPTQWLSMANAISTVVQATTPLLRDGAVIEFIVATKDPDFRDREAIFDPRALEPFQAILDFPGTAEERRLDDPDVQATYRTTLTYVAGVHAALLKRDSVRAICRRIMSFGPMIPRQYVLLLDERRPRALIILAHLAAIMKYVEEYWWFRGAAEREVYGINTLIPPEWKWAMDGPIRTLKELTMASGVSYGTGTPAMANH